MSGSTEFRAGLREGKLLGHACRDCGRKQATPMMRCPICKSSRIETRELPREGVVETYTIQRVAPEEFVNEVPYAVAVVRLEDGTRLTGWIPFVAAPEDLPIGARVRFTPSYKPGLQFERA